MITTLDNYFKTSTPKTTKNEYPKAMKNIDKPEFNDYDNFIEFQAEINGTRICGTSTIDNTLKALRESGECFDVRELDDQGFRASEFLEESYKQVKKFLNLKNKTMYKAGEDVYEAEIELYNFLDEEYYTFKWYLHLTYCPE